MFAHWEDLDRLYGRTRAGDPNAAWCLREVAVRRLSRFLMRAFDGNAPPSAVELSAEDGFVEAIRHSAQISTWREAWSYAKKTAWRACRRCFRRRRELSCDTEWIDPRSQWRTEAVDVMDEVLCSGIATDAAEAVILMDLIVGRFGISETAKAVRMGERSVKRRRRALRSEMRKRLR